MGKVDRLCNRVETFAALFWAPGNGLADHGRRPGISPPPTQSMSLYGHCWLYFQCSYQGMLFIYGLGTNGPPCVKVFCYSANSELFRKNFIYNLSWESLELIISCFLKRAIYVCVIPSLVVEV